MSEVIDISSSPAFLIIYSAYNLNKQGDSIQPWIYLSLPLYSYKGFDLGHTWMV